MSTIKMHENEIAIDLELVKSLIGQQFPQWAELSIEPIDSSGTDNAIFRLGSDKAIRLPRVTGNDSIIIKEYEWLPRLAPYISLEIPTPLAKGLPTQDYPCAWLIYLWIKGENATQMNFDLVQAANDLGNFVVELRKADTARAPVSRRNLPFNQIENEIQDALQALRGMIDIDAATKTWKKALEAPAWDGKPVWVHADLHAANILVNQNKITAVIDFGMAGIGDPACDMMPAWTLLSAQTRDIFRSIVQIDDAIWERGKGWALSFGLIALPYYKNTNPILAQIASRTINEVLAEIKE